MNLEEIMQLEKYARTAILNKISGLKSVNLIGTQGRDGNTNVAIFNSVTHVGANPPLLGILIRPTHVERHSYENIIQTGVFTINQVHEGIFEQAHHTSAKYYRDQSEFDMTKLTEERLAHFGAPFVRESALKIGLEFMEEHVINANKTVFLIGKIVFLSVPNDIVDTSGELDHEALGTVAVSGLDSYYSVKKIDRLGFARPNHTK